LLLIGLNDLRREPFRLLFPLGTIFGILGVGHWLFYAWGWSEHSSAFFHAGIQIGALMACFIAGFLLTALPRFSATDCASPAELLFFLFLLLAQPVLLSLAWWAAAETAFALLLAGLVFFAVRRFGRRRAPQGPPAEFVWIAIAVGHGWVGTLLLVAGQMGGPAWALAVGRPMVQQGFLLGIVMGVGGFMAPRLMGLGNPAGSKSLRVRLHLAAGALFFLSFLLEGISLIRAAYLLRAGVVAAEFFGAAKIHLPPRAPEPYLRFVRASLWMMPLGLAGAGLWSAYRIAMLHLVFLGGISLLTFSVATMVVLSHSGESSRLARPLWVLRLLGAGIAASVLARVAADLFPKHYFPLLAAASLAWIAAAAGWLLFALPWVTRPVPPELFERTHDQVKRRLLKQTTC
jgi:uncharacterized protein involved in response to NO